MSHHKVTCTRPSHFSAFNIEKVGVAWGQGYMYIFGLFHALMCIMYVTFFRHTVQEIALHMIAMPVLDLHVLT